MKWNDKEVRQFLSEHNLMTMMPLCVGIAGEELVDLYQMCKVNPSAMYRTLKFELLHRQHRLLPIATYLRFFSRMRSICEIKLETD
jgi:hypothetical protein